jgi:hypothetical protein
LGVRSSELGAGSWELATGNQERDRERDREEENGICLWPAGGIGFWPVDGIGLWPLGGIGVPPVIP